MSTTVLLDPPPHLVEKFLGAADDSPRGICWNQSHRAMSNRVSRREMGMRRYMIIGLGLLLVELCAAWAWGEAAQQRLLAIGWDSRPALREEQGAEEQEAA